MATLEQLTSVNLQTHWIAEQYGTLTCIKKDSRIVRIFKAIAGFITNTDYYRHINRDRVLSLIVQQAKNETDSIRVDKYIDVAAKIGREFKGRSQILDAHPEMVARFDAATKAYRVPADQTAIPPLSNQEQEALSTLNGLFTILFGPNLNYTVSKDDPQYLILLQTLKSQTSYPHDANGNYWIDSVCRHIIKATIPQDKLQSMTGSWKKVVLPEASYGMQQGEPLVMKRQVVYFKLDGTLQRNSKNQVEVIVQDQQARVKSDGTATLPNGRVLNLSIFHTNTVNASPYTFTSNYSPFDLPPNAK